MAADRLIRDNGSYSRYPKVLVHGHPRLKDPVEANDFWFGEVPGHETVDPHRVPQ
jgi:hypothetical protein